MYCGIRQSTEKAHHRRGNGLGIAYKRGATWTAAVFFRWEMVEVAQNAPHHRVPVKRYKGGFSTKREALEFISQFRSGRIVADTSKHATYWQTYESGKLVI